MSSKQLARTVIDGRKITLTFTTLPVPLSGYLCGMDDFHLFMITSDGQKHLIHKGSVAITTFAPEVVYQDEPLHDELEKVIGPFRIALQREHLAPTTSTARTERVSA